MPDETSIKKTLFLFGVITIGCRANQADSAGIVSLLSDKGIEVDIFSDKCDRCDLIILNSCTVTSRAEVDARKLIRRAKRKFPEAKVLVTGCAVQVEKGNWIDQPGVDYVLGINERDRISEILGLLNEKKYESVSVPSGGVLGPTPMAGHRSRPFLKIQDGCSRGCAYCIVPSARGSERSRPIELIAEDLRKLSEAGFREIVITGVHLGRWGCDIGRTFDDLLDLFDDLMRTGERTPLKSRIRFSSLEPMDLTVEQVRRMVSNPSICSHLHIPLQSGDQATLDRMGRGHKLEHFKALLEAAHETDPDVSLGTDLIVGFPGTDIKSHKNTVAFIKTIPLTYLHNFTYSPRAGTNAFSMGNVPKGRDVKDWMNELKEVDRSIRAAFMRSQVGVTRDFLIETPSSTVSTLTALSDNYIRARVRHSGLQSSIGHIVKLRIDINFEITDVG